jgi:hypothetical protein
MAFAKFKVKKGIITANDFFVNGFDTVPVGLIIPYGKNTPPSGWLMCDGTSTSGYTELSAIVGATTPNLSGYTVMGAGTGSGNGSSGNGFISGTTIPAKTINTAASTTSTNPMVNFSHSHGLGSHTHPMSHTHNYPHTHFYIHYHMNGSHGHTTSPSSTGNHQHRGYFANQIAPGTGAKSANSVQPAAIFPVVAAGGHFHSDSGAAAPPVGASGTPFGTSAPVNDFTASGTTTTGTDNTTTGSTGSASSPSGAFSIAQPTLGIYYIIKY